MKHRAENSGVAGAVPQYNAANRCAVRFKGNRWFHGAFSKVDIQLGHISAYICANWQRSIYPRISSWQQLFAQKIRRLNPKLKLP
jgi:hypothetical protein